MGLFNAIKRRVTVRREPRDDPDSPQAEQVHDPHTWDDDTRDTGRVERLKPSTFAQWAVFGFIVTFGMAVVMFFKPVFPPLFRNPDTLIGGFAFAMWAVLAIMFRHDGFMARSELDLSIITISKNRHRRGLLVRLGKLETTTGGDYKFKTVKSWHYGGFVDEYLQMKDTLPTTEDASLMSKKHRGGDGQSPAYDRLHRSHTTTVNTQLFGTVAVTHASGLEYDYESPECERTTIRPNTLDADDADELISELKFYENRQLPALRDEIDILENRMQQVKQRVDDETAPEVTRALKIVDRLSELSQANRQSSETELQARGRTPGRASESVNDAVDEKTGGQS